MNQKEVEVVAGVRLRAEALQSWLGGRPMELCDEEKKPILTAHRLHKYIRAKILALSETGHLDTPP